jgi:hypothetical protein
MTQGHTLTYADSELNSKSRKLHCSSSWDVVTTWGPTFTGLPNFAMSLLSKLNDILIEKKTKIGENC